MAGLPTSGPVPQFSDEEMAGRFAAVQRLCEDAGVDGVLAYGSDRSGSAVQWLTQWPVTREAAVLWWPGRSPVLLVEMANHVPAATRMAAAAEVSWGGPDLADTVERVIQSVGRHVSVGVIGPLSVRVRQRAEQAAVRLVELDSGYSGLRLVKSEAELAWLRHGAALTDAAVENLASKARIEASEYELGALLEAAYLPLGGTTHIHYLATTAMDDPQVCVPSQWLSARRLAAGDVLVCEVSASWWGYPGQLLRTFTAGVEPTALYRDLLAVADEVFEEMVHGLRPGASAVEAGQAAQARVEQAGFTTCDDLLHGFGGGYLAPVVPGGRRPGTRDVELQPGMAVVVQPNVVTLDGRAGVQTGELFVVTESGAESLHHFTRGTQIIG